MKTRIKESIDVIGTKKYYPQFRFLFFWLYFENVKYNGSDFVCTRVGFYSHEKAQAYLDIAEKLKRKSKKSL